MSSRDYYCCYSCEREKAKTTLLSSCKKPREKMEAGRKLHGTRNRFQHSNQPGLTRIDSNLTARRPDPPAAMDAFARSYKNALHFK